jgi:hypothetical protein
MKATIDREDVRLLVRLAIEANGRVDPRVIARRRRNSPARLAFEQAQRLGWLDGGGNVTRTGRRECAI